MRLNFTKVLFAGCLFLFASAGIANAQANPPILHAPSTVGINQDFWVMVWDSDAATARYEWDLSYTEGVYIRDSHSYNFRAQFYAIYGGTKTIRCRRVSPLVSGWSSIDILVTASSDTGGGDDGGKDKDELPVFPGM